MQVDTKIEDSTININLEIACHLGLDIMLAPRKLSVTVDTGDNIPSLGICKGLQILIAGEFFIIDCYIIPIDGFDLVLGVQWLSSLGPIVWDFQHLTLRF